MNTTSSAGCFEDICLKGTGLGRRDFLRLDLMFGRLAAQASAGVGPTHPHRQSIWDTTLPWGERGVFELDPTWPTLRLHSAGPLVDGPAYGRAWPVPLDCLAPVDRRFLEVECRWSSARCVVPEYLFPAADPDRSLVDHLCRAASWMEYAHRTSRSSHRRRLQRAG